MSVRDADPDWQSGAADRAKVAALAGGREAALHYIRPLPGHDDATGKKYRAGAYFLPITARSQEAFGGLVFAKTPMRNLPEALDGIAADVTRTGQDLDRFAEMAFDAVLTTGCVCIVADYPQAVEGVTVLQAEQQGIRPFLTLYDGSSILAARFVGEGSARVLGHVRLLETVEEPDPADEWALAVVEQVRVLDLDAAGLYRQRVFREVKSASVASTWVQHGETIEPRKAGARMPALPVYFTNARDAEPRPDTPPLRDLADVNIAHLNDSAAYQWGLVWTANPTPVFIGLNLNEGEGVKLGSSEGLALPIGGDAKFMEFTGAGLSELRASMEGKRRDGALMGARLLLEDGKSAITAETARIQRAGEVSVVAGIANAVSECLTKALAFVADWAGIDATVTNEKGATAPLSYWLNTNLNPSGLSAQDLAGLLAAWQAGAITLQDLYANLQQAEIVDPSKSFLDHQEQLAEAGEALGMIEANDDEPEAEGDAGEGEAA